MESNEQKERFIELRANGTSYEKISKELGVSKQTLINWSKEFIYQIRNLKAIALEALQEEYLIGKEKRIKMLGEQLKALRGELDKRDLSKLPTEKLLDFYLKYIDISRQEAIDIIFRQQGELIDTSFMDRVEQWSV